MKKSTVLVVWGFLCLIWLDPGHPQAITTIYALSGCSAAGDGSQSNPYCDLQQAFDAVAVAIQSSPVALNLQGDWNLTSTIIVSLAPSSSLVVNGITNSTIR